MKKTSTVVLAALVFLSACQTPEPPAVGGIRFRFPGGEEAEVLIGSEDRYLRELTLEQINNKGYPAEFPSKAAYSEFLSDQVLDWNPSEIRRVSSAIGTIADELGSYESLFPARVDFLLTTGEEEYGFAYTRNLDCVVLPRPMLRNASDGFLGYVVAHELFHILSRNNPELVRSLYPILGYEAISPVEVPPSLSGRLLINPDAPFIDAFCVSGIGGREALVAPLLLRPSAGNEFVDGKPFGLRFVELERTGSTFRVKGGDGGEQLHDLRDLDLCGFLTGQNTDYIIHPEEVLAENFVQLLIPKAFPENEGILEEIKTGLLTGIF